MSEIQYLQNLADMLDMYVGIETRKSVLAGNERLTLATDDHVWNQYLSQVARRVEVITDTEKRDKILNDIHYHIANQRITLSKQNSI